MTSIRQLKVISSFRYFFVDKRVLMDVKVEAESFRAGLRRSYLIRKPVAGQPISFLEELTDESANPFSSKVSRLLSAGAERSRGAGQWQWYFVVPLLSPRKFFRVQSAHSRAVHGRCSCIKLGCLWGARRRSLCPDNNAKRRSATGYADGSFASESVPQTVQPVLAFYSGARARREAQRETVSRDDRYCWDSVPANATAVGHNLSLSCAGIATESQATGPGGNHADHSVQKSPTIRELAHRKCVARCFYFASVFTGRELRAKPPIRLAPCSPVRGTVKLGNGGCNQSQLLLGIEHPFAGRRGCL
jgi:hypothetical protein